MRKLFLSFIILFISHYSFAQHLLGKVVSISVTNQTLASVLNSLSKKGDFQFSYKSDIIPQDKKVTINEENKTVKYILDKLLEGYCHYTEKGKYIIIHAGGERFFTISGFIEDGNTGKRLSNVTVYEEQILASTLTNEEGYFKLPIKNKHKLKTISIVVRKEAFNENSVSVNTGYDQEIVLPIVPIKEIILDDLIIKNRRKDQNWATRLFISSKQKILSMNIGNFIAKRPIQTSFIPGIGTHGMISAQVVNKFSLNILGGYTGGVNGVEIGSLFNINRGNVRYFQAAGIFNSVKGEVSGMQASGIFNYVSGNTNGFQAAGIDNLNLAKVSGVQIAGISNLVKDTLNGVQIAGVSNYNEAFSNGVQLAGIANINKEMTLGVQLAGVTNHCDSNMIGFQLAGVSNHARKAMRGMQMSGVYNYARKIRGVQFSVVNVADSIDGIGIGLINLYKNGRQQLVVSSTELQNMNVGFLSGTNGLYSIIGMGANADINQQAYSISYGVGSRINLSKKIALSPEILGQSFYLGTWDYIPIVGKAQINISYNLTKKLEVFTGVSYAVAENRRPNSVTNYSLWLQSSNIHYRIIDNNNLASWMGWQIGIRLF